MVVLANLVPLGRTNRGFLVHTLGFAGGIHSRCGGITVAAVTHGPLGKLIKRKALGEIIRVKGSTGRRRIFVLRSVGSQSRFGSAQSILIGNTVLSTNMLKDLLIDVQVGGIRKPMLVTQAMAEVGLGFGGMDTAVATVR